ncbi:hypothetical protein HCN44_007676 [Aphidius gifuensis]|uniref:Apoptosis regulatory protein Siva n=2 Tax=Aphidius gifuensis TaxID=684658 RepID=A0A834XJZ7_APHGI|nr:hypothetical protein HCN44_007676 [Aphidius gifuensis]
MSNKRRCPFEDNLMPQLKVHVGLKDSADPLERDKEMKKIYERTLQLLKNGSMKCHDKLLNNQLSNYKKQINGSSVEAPPASRLKQMIINGNLGLELATKIITEPLDKSHPCTDCRDETSGNNSLRCCYHCMKYYCEICLNQCTKCLESYCSKCSLTV